jgi:ribosomal protein L16 Arg81 hydroxylase
MTLSVGLRAPSAREMINQIAEYTSSCFTSHRLAKRYDDPLFLEAYRNSREDTNNSAISATLSPRAEISRATKDDMKRLVRDALDHILDNESVFDEILGALLTEPKRLRINYPVTSNIEEKALDSQLNLILNHGVGSLHPRNSICFAYSEIHNNNLKVCRLFVDGNKWEIESDGSDQQEKEISMLKAITHGIGLSRESFIDAETDPDGSIPIRIRQILKDLILRGYLQIDS